MHYKVIIQSKNYCASIGQYYAYKNKHSCTLRGQAAEMWLTHWGRWLNMQKKCLTPPHPVKKNVRPPPNEVKNNA